MADPFRTSKEILGGTSVTRKGSKYDKDSDAYVKQYPIKEYPDTERSNADALVGIDLKSSAGVAKDRGKTATGPAIYDSDRAVDRFDHTNKSYKKTQ